MRAGENRAVEHVALHDDARVDRMLMRAEANAAAADVGGKRLRSSGGPSASDDQAAAKKRARG